MARPLLQIALDNLSLEDALNSLKGGVDEAIDIIECGTLLLAAEGARVIKIIRTLYPEKTLVADFKIADAGNVLGGLILDGEPDYATVICAAHPGTMKAVKEEAEKRGRGTQVQLELYGNWNFDDVETWKSMGIKQVILHHSRDAKGGWTPEEIALLKQLCDAGMEVTATGGISYEDLELFKGLPLFCFICGRSIRNAADPKAEVLRMKAKIAELWPEE